MSETQYPVALYELVHCGSPGDVAFYLAICDGAETVLELGCGSGRVSLPLAEKGHRVVGLDVHPGMVQRFAERCATLPEVVSQRIEVMVADMATFCLNRRFERIIIPHSGLYCLLTEEQLVNCFRAVNAHLADDGLLVFDAYAVDAFHRECAPEDQSDEELDHVVTVEHDGVIFDVFERSSWDRDQQSLDANYLYLARDGRPEISTHIKQRYLLGEQVAALLNQANLSLESLAGDFCGGVFSEESDQMVVTARRGPR